MSSVTKRFGMLKFYSLLSTRALRSPVLFLSSGTREVTVKPSCVWLKKQKMCRKSTPYYITSRYNSSCENPDINIDEQTVEKLTSMFGVEPDALRCSVESCPELMKFRTSQWECCFRQLVHCGFSPDECLVMVTRYPPLLTLNIKTIANSVNRWRSSQIGDDYIVSLLKTCPHFLQLREQEISRRVAVLKSLGSKKNVIQLLKGAPDIMFENWNNITAKLSFLENEMNIDSKDILKSFALNRSLIFLKTRFTFLLRSGKYTIRKRDAEPVVTNKNPTLNSIVDMSDEVFVTSLAGLTLEEYEVFQNLYEEEIKSTEHSDSDSE